MKQIDLNQVEESRDPFEPIMGAQEVLKWAVKHYANPEINHVDYRVTVCKMAETALTQPQPTGDVVERVASAIYEQRRLYDDAQGTPILWDKASEWHKSYYYGLAKAALSAMQQPTAPAGALTEDEAVRIIDRWIMDNGKVTAYSMDGATVEVEPTVAAIGISRALITANALPPKSEWRPIETAPKDGTSIITANTMQGGLRYIAWWNKIHGYWCGSGGTHCQFTHWMPLPEPPLSATAKGGE